MRVDRLLRTWRKREREVKRTERLWLFLEVGQDRHSFRQLRIR
jgi:hypothetical protein